MRSALQPVRPYLGALLAALWLVACGDPSGSADPQVSGQNKPMVLAPGWVTGSAWPSDTVVALNSVAIRSTAYVKGSVAVIQAGTGAFLDSGSELSIGTNAEIDGNVRADSIATVVAAHVLGAASYNQLTGLGTIDGTKTTTLSMPLSIPIVAAASFSAGSTAITVSASTTSSRSSGSYGTVTVNSGTPASPTVLRLSSGTYNFNWLTLGNYARVECTGTCEIRVKNRVSTASYAYIGPFGGNNSQNMTQVKLYVEGVNGVTGPTGTPPAASIGLRSELKAFTFVPNGTLALGQSVTGVGKFIAKDVDVGTDTELMDGTTTQRVLNLRWVVGPSWPNEVITAWNSIDVLSNTVVSGNVAVISNSGGPYLNGREATVGTSARINGSLRADAVALGSGSVVTGQVQYNTISNSGSAGSLVNSLPLPLDIRVPVFPLTTNNSSSYSVSSRLDRTLAAGTYRDITLNAGISSDLTTLTLSGGVYKFRRLYLNSYSSLICAAACELWIKDRIANSSNTSILPAAGLDASKVKIYVYRSNSSPTSTPYSVSFGTNSRVEAFLFAPRGTLEAQSGTVLQGRFIARDVRLGSGTNSERTGASEIAPAIQTPPQSVNVVAGQPATFTVQASGTDITFLWKRNGVAIPGATSTSYSIAATTIADDNGMYTVTVSNSAGTVTSAAALLNVGVCSPSTYVPQATTCGQGACARTGVTSCTVDGEVRDSCVAGTPGASDTSCDSVDNDCNGQVDEDYVQVATTCGSGACSATGVTSCVAGVVRDSCTTSVAAPNDTTCDGRDDDCNGQVDEDFVAFTTSCGEGACLRTGVATCVLGALEDSCTPGNPANSDADCDGVDDDCDGEADQDYEAVATSCGAGACRSTGETDCVNGVVVDSCRAGTNAPSDATCDGIDDDCNGQTDEDYVGASTACGVGACARAGTLTCISGEVTNTCQPGTPAANDATCDSVDNDCSGQTDEDYVSVTTTCGSGTCTATGVSSCVSGSVQSSCVVPTSDRDNDTVRDCADGCPDDAAKIAPGTCGCGRAETDGDGDGLKDCVDTCPLDALNDVDGDGVCGNVDNCPTVANPGQENVDADADGDACDAPTSTSVAAGGLHSCALVVDGQVGCWGDNSKGQLGNGTTSSAVNPVFVSGLTDAVEVSVGYEHSCARRSSGAVVCWGDNSTGQLGNGSTTNASAPVVVSGLTDATSVTAGHDHTCARRATGAVVCWGSNANRQLGDGTTVATATAPVTVTGLSDATQVGAGYGHTCALRATGKVVCWGANWYGEIGNTTQAIETDAPAPVEVAGISDATGLGVGGLHNCARRATGGVMCWGSNSYGQLGDGTTTDARTPVTASGLSDASDVRAGLLHSCARRPSGAMMCWGYNTYGQVGNATYTDVLTPATVSLIADVTDIALGDTHTCAVRSSGEVNCWGDASSGQLGGASERANIPMTVVGQTSKQSVSVGSTFVCSLSSAGTVGCWGFNQYGQLGDGTTTLSTTGTSVTGLSGVSAISSGFVHVCALLSDGTVRCWGRGGDGQLGNGALDDSSTTVAVSGLTSATQLSSGGSHTCARRSDGTVRCWGDNSKGQLGDGTRTDASTPIAVSGLTNVVAVAAGGTHTCAVLTTGAVRCWGEGSQGRLGNGSTSDALTPAAVTGISDATAITAGKDHSCALRSSGQVVCWGKGGSGQLGDGRGTDTYTPVTVSNISNASAITAGGTHSCARLSNGQLRCWGLNDDGQAGDGDNVNADVPAVVSNIYTAQVVSAGYHSTCTALSDGTLRCWGAGTFGELGNGYPWSGLATRVLW